MRSCLIVLTALAVLPRVSQARYQDEGIRSTSTADWSSVEEDHLPLRWLSQGELSELSKRRLMSLKEAEAHFDSEAAKAIAVAAVAHADSSNEEDLDIEDVRTNLRAWRDTTTSTTSKSEVNKDGLADADFFDSWEQADLGVEKFKNYSKLFKPKLTANMCVQIDIDLSVLVPGLSINVGLLGGVEHTHDGCWAMHFEAYLGFSWGIKFLGFNFGLAINAGGSVKVAETTHAKASGIKPGDDLKDFDFDERTSRKVEFDPFRCSTRNPWSVVQTFIEHEWKRLFSRKKVQKAVDDKSFNATADHAEKAKQLQDTYTHLINDEPAGQLQAAKDALHGCLLEFLPRIPPYADQVMRQLVDKTETLFTKERYKAAKGRYWAKWPSREDMEDMKEDDEDTVPAEPVVGIDVSAAGADQRVINFAKPMRHSENKEDPDMWQELAMSAGNLFLRVVGDIEALFSLHFAADPYWDGRCGSLLGEFEVGEVDAELLKAYPWASKYTKKSGAYVRFHKRTQDTKGQPFDRVNPDGMEAGSEKKIHPHLWCALMSHAPAEIPFGELAVVSQYRLITKPLPLRVVQSCDSSQLDYQPLVESEDELKWVEEMQCFGVYRGRQWDYRGKLVTESGYCVAHHDVPCALGPNGTVTHNCIHKLSKEENYMIADQEVSQRMECQEIELGVPFVRLFPNFVHKVMLYLAKIEAHLLNINLCRGKAHDLEEVGKRIKEYPEAASLLRSDYTFCGEGGHALKYVEMQSRYAVQLVRMFLLEIGAENPKTAVSKFKDEGLPLSEEEERMIKAVDEDPESYAKITRQLGKDFESSLHAKTGNMWKHLGSMREKVLESADFTNNAMKITIDRKRPPIDIEVSLGLEAMTNPNGYCTPNTALLVVKASIQAHYSSYTSDSLVESCFLGRIRPGDFFILVMRCSTDDYADWRVTFQGVLIKGNILSDPSGILGILTNGVNIGSLIGGGVVAAGTAAGPTIDAMAMKVHDHPILKAVGIMAAATSPLLGAVAIGAAVAGLTSFESVCRTFLSFLSDYGVVAVDSAVSSFSPVALKLALVARGSTVYREKKVTMEGGPGASHPKEKREVTRVYKMTSFHVENWNRLEVIFQVPGVITFAPVVNVDLQFDLTPWAVNYVNRIYFRRQKERVRDCFRCLYNKQAFCDLRAVMGNRWDKKMDECQDDSAANMKACVGTKVQVGEETLSGVWLGPEDGPDECIDTMVAQRCNEDFHETTGMKSFLSGSARWPSYKEVLDNWALGMADFDDIIGEGTGDHGPDVGGDDDDSPGEGKVHRQSGWLRFFKWMAGISCFIALPAGLAAYHFGLPRCPGRPAPAGLPNENRGAGMELARISAPAAGDQDTPTSQVPSGAPPSWAGAA